MASIYRLAAGLTLALTAHAALALAPGAPVRMRMCAMDVDYPPFAKVDGTGTLQYLVFQAAKGLNITLERHVAPRRRCLEEIKAGISDAMASAYAPQREDIAVFPKAEGSIDASMALGVMTYYVYRRKDSPLDWDGRRFTQLGDKKIGVQSGFVFITDRLQQLNVRYDDGAKALDPTMAKLAAGRVAGVVGMMEEADRLIARRYRGQMERTSRVFEQTPVYLMVSRQFYGQHPQLVERYWAAMRDYRTSLDYRRYQMRHP